MTSILWPWCIYCTSKLHSTISSMCVWDAYTYPVPGAHNNIADALSCFQMTKFYQLNPLARHALDPILVWPLQSLLLAIPSSWSSRLSPMLTLIIHVYIGLPTLLHQVHLLTTASIIPNSTVFFVLANHNTYVTWKVYLCGIRLCHIEEGLSDPTNDPPCN